MTKPARTSSEVRGKASRRPAQFSTPAESKNRPALAAQGRTVLLVSEVADRLAVSSRHVLNLIEEGKLRAINVGSSGRLYYRIPLAWFEDYLRRAAASIGGPCE